MSANALLLLSSADLKWEDRLKLARRPTSPAATCLDLLCAPTFYSSTSYDLHQQTINSNTRPTA